MAQQVQAMSIRAGQRLPNLINLVLIVLLCLTLARIIWLLVPAQTPAAKALPGVGLNQPDSGGAPTTDFNSILSVNLFGQARQDEEPAEIDPLVAPETRLNLTLTGIFAATDKKQSRALIKDDSGKQRPYATGDDIPGNARLYSIHNDRVLLERKGRYETLRLQQDKLDSSDTGNSRFEPPSDSATEDLSGEALATLSEVREELLQDPTKAGQYIRLQPVYNQGQLQGYRVYPGRNRQLFKDVGLRAGEMVTSVNGTQLDDPTRALQMLTELSSASQLSVTLQRAGQTRTVNINLNQ